MLLLVEVISALGSGTSTDKACWAIAHAQNNESWTQLQIGLTLELIRGKESGPALISFNKKAGCATIENADTADEHVYGGLGVTDAPTPHVACDAQICLRGYWRN